MNDRHRAAMVAVAAIVGMLGCAEERPPAPPARPGPIVRAPSPVEADRELSGRLVDTLGQPVADGVVHLLGGRAGDGRELVAATSDARGSFRVRIHDAPESLVLVVTHGRFPPRVLDIPSGADLGDVALPSAIGCTVEVFRIETRGPIPDARVRIEPVLFDSRLADASLLSRSGTSGPNGRAELYGVPPGTYRMRVEAPGLIPVERTHVQPSNPGSPPRVRVLMVPGHRVVGRAIRPDGTPAARARIEAFVGDDGGAPAETTWAGDDGDFRLTRLGEGPLRLHAVLEPDLVGDAAAASLPQDDPVLIRLARPDPLSGSVVDAATGLPLPGASVRAVPAGRRSPPPPPTAVPSITRTDAEGRFRFEDVFVGRWDILATSNRRVPARFGPLELPRNGPLELRLGRAAKVTGTIHGASGRPLPGAVIDVMPATFDGSALALFQATAGPAGARLAAARAAPDGTFAVATGAASLRLVVRAPGHAAFVTDPIDPTDPAGGDPIAIRLERGAHVRGTARRADGSPAAGARVCADPVGATGRARVAADGLVADDGRFDLGPLSAGPYEVFYYSSDRDRSAGDLAGQVASTRVQIEVGGDTPIECELSPR